MPAFFVGERKKDVPMLSTLPKRDPTDEDVATLAKHFHDTNIKFCMIGGYTMIKYGQPNRTTHDLDVLIDPETKLDDLKKALSYLPGNKIAQVTENQLRKATILRLLDGGVLMDLMKETRGYELREMGLVYEKINGVDVPFTDIPSLYKIKKRIVDISAPGNKHEEDILWIENKLYPQNDVNKESSTTCACVEKSLYEGKSMVFKKDNPKKLLLKSKLALGDMVMLTAAVRDLHKSYPGEFQTDVSTSCMDVWSNNPYITNLDGKPDVETIHCNYPLINKSNTAPYHFIHGYIQDLNKALGINIIPSEFKGDIHLLLQEKNWMSQVQETGHIGPFWIVVAGGKDDFTAKHWSHDRWQAVVNHFKDKITFVQVGQKDHMHKPLNNVINFLGKTNIRQLIRLVYHSAGVVCPVTSLMHLAAAVPTKTHRLRPCVVVAGGREPVHWEQYPGHQYLHTIGALPCCAHGGCWKSRTLPLGDGDEKDNSLCVNVVDNLPKCMNMITPEKVIEAINLYLQNVPNSH